MSIGLHSSRDRGSLDKVVGEVIEDNVVVGFRVVVEVDVVG